MSNTPKNTKTDQAAANDLQAKVKDLQNLITQGQQEILILRGRYKNNNPKVAEKLKSENEELRKRVERLEKALLIVVKDGVKPRTAALDQLQFDILKDAVVAYCQEKNVDPGIWKNLVF